MADRLKDGWFTEYGSLWPGQAMSLEIEQVLFQQKSQFQEVIVYKSKTYGTVLVLDGVIQITDRDWHAYQEMIAHTALLVHPNPENVLIVGGGDGAVIGEVLKHHSLKKLVLVEIDKMVVDVSKKFFPQFNGWNDPRLTVLFDDGAKYIEQNKNAFDLIIVDSSDPVGPAETLYTNAFYQSIKSALRVGGVFVQQAENVWLHLEIIQKLLSFAKGIFESVDYNYTTIPTYPGGQIGFLLCSNKKDVDFRHPTRKVADALVSGASMKYYTERIHHASFVLPAFAEEVLKVEHTHHHHHHAEQKK